MNFEPLEEIVEKLAAAELVSSSTRKLSAEGEKSMLETAFQVDLVSNDVNSVDSDPEYGASG